MDGTNSFASGNIIIVIIFFTIFIIVFIIWKNSYKKQLLLDNLICYLTFIISGKQYCCTALLDTGHSVRSVFNEPVIFLKKKFDLREGDYERQLVRFKTVSGIEEMYGTKIQNVEIIYQESKIKCDVVVVNSSFIDDSYDAIVGYDLIEGGMKCGNNNDDKAKSQKAFSEFFNITWFK